MAATLPAVSDSADSAYPDVMNGRSWTFNVFLDKRPIGFHRFDIRKSGDRFVVDIEAEFEVEVFFVTAYRYLHDNLETWQDGCLVNIESTTDDNGDTYRVAGAAGDDMFLLERNDVQTRVEANCLKTFAYWNPLILDAERLLNAQTGVITDVSVEPVGLTPFDVNGVTVSSEEYLLNMSDGAIRLWYEKDSGQWLGLETQTKGGRLLRYVPDRLPDPPEAGQLAENGHADLSTRLPPP
jgi:hypothetical protein